jgi:hypothetical protein
MHPRSAGWGTSYGSNPVAIVDPVASGASRFRLVVVEPSRACWCGWTLEGLSAAARQGSSQRGGRLRRAKRFVAGAEGRQYGERLLGAGHSAFVTPPAMPAALATGGRADSREVIEVLRPAPA